MSQSDFHTVGDKFSKDPNRLTHRLIKINWLCIANIVLTGMPSYVFFFSFVFFLQRMTIVIMTIHRKMFTTIPNTPPIIAVGEMPPLSPATK